MKSFTFSAVIFATLVMSESVKAEGPVKAFLLAGQSNMQGHGEPEIGKRFVPGAIGSLRYEVDNDPANYGHLVDGAGNWIERDDVWIWSATDGGEKGNLSVGFGVSHKIGPELGFGNVVGDQYDDQVLLIKAAWGGKSLAVDFRPPSAVAKRGGTVGTYYNEVINTYNSVINNIETHFPDYNGQGVELAGFGWHQGWNDRGNASFVAEYEANLVDFIGDIRDDLNAPGLPFVVAETGMTGKYEFNTTALALMAAQEAVTDFGKYPQFEGNVDFVGTRDFYRVPQVSPNGIDYHWNLNGETYYLIGDGMGNAMTAMVPEPASLAILALGMTIISARRRKRNH